MSAATVTKPHDSLIPRYSESQQEFIAWYEEMRQRAHNEGIMLFPLTDLEIRRFASGVNLA